MGHSVQVLGTAGRGPRSLTQNTRAIRLEDCTGQQKVFSSHRGSGPIERPIVSTALHNSFISLPASYEEWRCTIFVRSVGVDIRPLQQHLPAPCSQLRIAVCCHLRLQHSHRDPIASAKSPPLLCTPAYPL